MKAAYDGCGSGSEALMATSREARIYNPYGYVERTSEAKLRHAFSLGILGTRDVQTPGCKWNWGFWIRLFWIFWIFWILLNFLKPHMASKTRELHGSVEKTHLVKASKQRLVFLEKHWFYLVKPIFFSEYTTLLTCLHQVCFFDTPMHFNRFWWQMGIQKIQKYSKKSKNSKNSK